VEPQMGGPDRTVVEGSLSIDRVTAYPLIPTASAPILPKEVTLFVVKVDFTLSPLTGTKNCREMTLHLAVSHPDDAVDLFPRRIESPQDVPQSLSISPTQNLIGAHDSQGLFPVDALAPTIRGFSRQGHDLYWTFAPGEGSSISPGSRSVFFVLRTLKVRTQAPLAVDCEAKIGSYLFGRWWWPSPATSAAARLVIPLRSS
jgi:hypothetical protein